MAAAGSVHQSDFDACLALAPSKLAGGDVPGLLTQAG